jgi:hypothetical protein
MRFSITLLATFAASASAYDANSRTFAVNHFYGNGPLVMGRMDPIVSPGGPSGHVHAVQGGNAFALTMTDDQALSSTCTSSLVKNDKSNYWTPSLYFQDPTTGLLEDVEMFYMNVYYFFEATTDVIEAFPPGLRMVVGNPSLRSPPSTGGQSIIDQADGPIQPVQWVCPRSNTNSPLYPPNSDGLHGVGIQDPGNAGAGVGFPDQNCDGYASPLRADVHFPSCFNKSAGIDDYKNNMVFPINGNCPSGFIHTPHLFYEVYWNTPLFASRWTQGQGNQPFVLSNGDPTGYSLHGDFLAGWDVATLTQIINNCNAGDSGMDKCPGLMGGLNDPSTSCNINSPIDEVISGTLSKLPGNNPIGQWGVAATGGAPGSASVVGGTYPTSAGSQPASSAAAGGGKATTTAGVATDVKSGPTPTESSPGKVQAVSVVSIPATTEPATGGGNTLVTSYVSETTVVWTTVTASGSAPTNAASQEDVDGWKYYGCYQDTRARVLSGIKLANIGNHEVTNTKCVAYCGAAGFSMAGTEYGGQCFCGDQLVGSSKIDESDCSMPCEGDASETCGGGLALSIYTSNSTTTKRSARHMHRHINRITF